MKKKNKKNLYMKELNLKEAVNIKKQFFILKINLQNISNLDKKFKNKKMVQN